MHLTATFSACGKHRYTLRRDVNPQASGTVLFVMLNPSTADGEHNDPTIDACMMFTRTHGFRYLTVGNLYTYRATQPKALREVADLGDGNNANTVLVKLAAEADAVVVAWGASDIITTARVFEVESILREHHPVLYCLAKNKNGSPKHPLYIPHRARFQEWERP